MSVPTLAPTSSSWRGDQKDGGEAWWNCFAAWTASAIHDRFTLRVVKFWGHPGTG
jgi:hypothetical protein